MEPDDQSWELIERGAFAFAQCRRCGWLSPARRAYSSARKEAVTHEGSCPAVLSEEPTPS